MLTSILLETKYVTTLWEISSSLRNFQTFKCHEKALSKPYQLHSSKLCLEIRYVKFFPTYFFRLKFILAARAWRFCAVTGSFKRQQVRWIQKLYYLTQKKQKMSQKILLMKLSVKIIRVTKKCIRNLQKYIVKLSLVVLGQLLCILGFIRYCASTSWWKRFILNFLTEKIVVYNWHLATNVWLFGEKEKKKEKEKAKIKKIKRWKTRILLQLLNNQMLLPCLFC